MPPLEFRRRLDSVCYRFAPAGTVGGRPSWKRDDLDLWLVHRAGDGWVVVDASDAILSRPASSPQSELPPAGEWHSKKGEVAYVYDLVFV